MHELDEALERFFETDCVYADGEPNYGPMAASALEALGHGALTTGLLDIYVPRLPDFERGAPLARDEWRHHAADPGTAPALIAALERELTEGDWSTLVAVIVALRLEVEDVPGPDPHAIVRLGYAIQNLERRFSSTRLCELAYALGFVLASRREADPPPSPPSTGTPAERLTAASVAGAEHYLANPEDRRSASLGVILPAALRVILPHLEPDSEGSVLDALLPAKVAPDAADPTRTEEDIEVLRCAEDLREIRYRAACSVQEHAIVMAESCLREAAFSPNSKLQLAAADAALRLSPPGYREWR